MNTDKESDTLRAHVFSTHNRNALAKDKLCGCFDCIKVFSPSEIEEYTEEDTALCPYCGNDSVIGESSGFPITEDFMLRMHRRWMASGCGIQIETPFGKILFFLDDVPVSFEYRSIDPDETLLLHEQIWCRCVRSDNICLRGSIDVATFCATPPAFYIRKPILLIHQCATAIAVQCYIANHIIGFFVHQQHPAFRTCPHASSRIKPLLPIQRCSAVRAEIFSHIRASYHRFINTAFGTFQ